MTSILGLRVIRFLPAALSAAPFMPCCFNFALGTNLPMPCCAVGNQLMMCCQRFFG